MLFSQFVEVVSNGNGVQGDDACDEVVAVFHLLVSVSTLELCLPLFGSLCLFCTFCGKLIVSALGFFILCLAVLFRLSGCCAPGIGIVLLYTCCRRGGLCRAFFSRLGGCALCGLGLFCRDMLLD